MVKKGGKQKGIQNNSNKAMGCCMENHHHCTHFDLEVNHLVKKFPKENGLKIFGLVMN